MRRAEHCGRAVRHTAEAGRPQLAGGQAQAGGVDGGRSAQAGVVSRTLSLSVTGALAVPGALARRRQRRRPWRAQDAGLGGQVYDRETLMRGMDGMGGMGGMGGMPGMGAPAGPRSGTSQTPFLLKGHSSPWSSLG